MRFTLVSLLVAAAALAGHAADRESKESNTSAPQPEWLDDCTPTHPSRDKAMISAAEFVSGVVKAGGISECRPDEHGSLSVWGDPPEERGPVHYPAAFIVQIRKNGSDDRNYYRVEKKTRSSRWRFTRAWKEKDGRWIAELILPK